jgi:hypothetical protein
MATRKRFSKVSFNKNLIMDVIGASLIVQIAPGLIDKVFSLDPSIKALVGVGAGYLVGSMIKRPDLANASIGLGVVDFITPMVSGLLGGGTPIVPGTTAGTSPALPMRTDEVALEDVFRLNDYVSSPIMQVNATYRNSY